MSLERHDFIFKKISTLKLVHVILSAADRENQSVLITWVVSCGDLIRKCTDWFFSAAFILFILCSQWRIRCREDCQHQACHPVLCDNRSCWWRQEGALVWQNAGNPFDEVRAELWDKRGKIVGSWWGRLCFSGDSGRSNHLSEPSAGGVWECQDCEERQLLQICEYEL